jgi:hypothetical protein
VSAGRCGQAAAVGGDVASASVFTAEPDAVKEATASRIAPLAALALAGVRGHEPGASQLIGQVIMDATAQGQGVAVRYTQWAKSVLMNGLGRYEEALDAAVEATEAMPLSPTTVEWHLRKVFAKLDIRSRKELANALPQSESRLVAD